MTDHPTALRADVLPDLIRHWCGPCEIHDGEDWASVALLGWGTPGHWPIVYAGSGDHEGVDPRRLRLDLSLPECRAQLRLVLERGLRCPNCGGRGVLSCDPEDEDCPACAGGGCLRAPVATSHLMPRCEGGSLPDAHAHHAPALLVAHATSVAAGGRGIVGVLNPLAEKSAGINGRYWLRNNGKLVVWENAGNRSYGWQFWPRTPSVGPDATGPETGDAGKAAADAAALAAGYALLDSGGTLHLPTDACEGEEKP